MPRNKFRPRVKEWEKAEEQLDRVLGNPTTADKIRRLDTKNNSGDRQQATNLEEVVKGVVQRVMGEGPESGRVRWEVITVQSRERK